MIVDQIDIFLIDVVCFHIYFCHDMKKYTEEQDALLIGLNFHFLFSIRTMSRAQSKRLDSDQCAMKVT